LLFSSIVSKMAGVNNSNMGSMTPAQAQQLQESNQLLQELAMIPGLKPMGPLAPKPQIARRQTLEAALAIIHAQVPDVDMSKEAAKTRIKRRKAVGGLIEGEGTRHQIAMRGLQVEQQALERTRAHDDNVVALHAEYELDEKINYGGERTERISEQRQEAKRAREERMRDKWRAEEESRPPSLEGMSMGGRADEDDDDSGPRRKNARKNEDDQND